jgi:uncharacterized protein YcbK (DUF882 family)
VGDLSAHFSRWEFVDHTTGGLVGPDPALIELLERIRASVGRPLRIVSGYRSPTHNRAVGGARRSYHLTGRAADFERGVVPVSVAVAAGAGGIGSCDGWAVHIDTRRSRSSGRPVIFRDC